MKPLKKRINTTISLELYEDIKECGVSFNQLIGLGLLAWKDNPQLIERIKRCEHQNVMLDNMVKQLNQKVLKLETTVNK